MTRLQLRPRRSWQRDNLSTRELSEWFLFVGDGLERGLSLRRLVDLSRSLYPRHRDLFTRLDQALLAGSPLAEALAPKLGIDTYYQLQLAEQHGNLGATLQQLGRFLTMRDQQRQRLKGLLQYPLLLVVFLIGVLWVILTWVMPEVGSWDGAGTPRLPAVAHLILWNALGVGGALLGSGAWRWWHLDRESRVSLSCRFPLIGRSVRLYWHYYLTANLAVMVSNGMSLREVATVVDQFDHRSMLYLVGQRLTRACAAGRSLDQAVAPLVYLPGELPAFFNRGLSQTELGRELSALARLDFQRLNRTSGQLLELLQPLLLLLIAAAVVGMYLMLLMPIYHSLQVVN